MRSPIEQRFGIAAAAEPFVRGGEAAVEEADADAFAGGGADPLHNVRSG